MEKSKKTGKIITIVITIVILILLALVVLIKTGIIKFDFKNNTENNLENVDTNNDNNNDKDDDSSIVMDQNTKDLKSYKYYLWEENNEWYLIKTLRQDFGGGTTPQERLKSIPNEVGEQFNPSRYVSGYYIDNKFYNAIISDSKLIIKEIDFSQDGIKLEEYINIDMPSDYKLCGIWEGNRVDNDCTADFIYIDNEYMYIYTIGPDFNEVIYLLNTNSKEIKKIYDSPVQAMLHDHMVGWKHGDDMIIVGQSGILIENAIEHKFESIFGPETMYGLFLDSIKASDNNLYFTVKEIDYPEENSNKRIEKTITYKYNFDSHEKTIINEKSKTFN